MTQYIDKSKVVEEIEKMLQNEYACETSQEETGYHCALHELKHFLDTFEVKEVQEEPAKFWHDAKEPPEMYRKYFARYSDGRINGSWERHDDGFIPWKDVIKEHNITHWCYVEDLLKLKYYDSN